MSGGCFKVSLVISHWSLVISHELGEIMGNGRFQELRVYQLSKKLADDIWKIVKKWDSLPQNTLGKQIIRSADSIGANIAEGVERGSYVENRRFIRIARGSLYETQH